MPEKTIPAREPSSISMLAGWLRQGTESFFASQRILTDLVMRQNAHTIGAFQGRLTEARNIAGAAVTEIAGEGISSFIAAQRVLLNLAQRQNELLTTVVKERIDGPAPVALYHVAGNPHSDTMLMVHVPSERVLIEVDAFSPGAAVNPYAANLLENITRRNLRVDRIVSLHGGIAPFADLAKVAAPSTTH